MRPATTLTVVVALACAGALLSGCGASSLQDAETATEAAAATPATTDAATAPATASATDATSSSDGQTATSADDAGAWATIRDGAQTFAAQLDRSTQSVASCQTDAAAGADFDQCVGRAYTEIATAATELGTTIDGAIDRSAGDCHAALTTLRGATQTMADDYTLAVGTTDLTSRQTLETRLGDDGQVYADAALAAAAACVG